MASGAASAPGMVSIASPSTLRSASGTTASRAASTPVKASIARAPGSALGATASRAASVPATMSTVTACGSRSHEPEEEIFARVFYAERAVRYGDQDGGRVGAEGRKAIRAYVVGLTAEACAWATCRGLEPDRNAVREDLCRHLARLVLDWPGSTGVLRERRHPIGLIVGDLHRVADDALGAWKRAQRPMPPATPPVYEAEVWPELDTTEPEPAELEAIRADLGVLPVPATPGSMPMRREGHERGPPAR